MSISKKEFTSLAVAFAKQRDWLYFVQDEFEFQGGDWFMKMNFLPPDDFPEIYVSYRLGHTWYRAWVYPTEDYRIDVVF